MHTWTVIVSLAGLPRQMIIRVYNYLVLIVMVGDRYKEENFREKQTETSGVTTHRVVVMDGDRYKGENFRGKQRRQG